MLSWIELFFVGDYATAGALLQDATARYSTGVFFLYLNGYLYRKQGMIDLGLRSMHSALTVANRRPLALATFRRAYDASGDVRQLALACLYEIGWCQYLAMEWDDAVQSLDTFLHEHTSPSFRAFAAYQLVRASALCRRAKVHRSGCVARHQQSLGGGQRRVCQSGRLGAATFYV